MTLREFIGSALESYIPLYVRDGNGHEARINAHQWQLEGERKLAWAADKEVESYIIYWDRVVVNVI